jgi:HlyD family secretion protein
MDFSMGADDLSKLRIDKKTFQVRSRTRSRYFLLILGLIAVAAAWVMYRTGLLQPAVAVQVAAVQTIYPSQIFTLLNASGYVVAQRKAAVASKITGRLVYLAVEEGDHVKAGQIIARLEDRDLQAARDRASENVKVARFNLVQAQAELQEALLAYTRHKELWAKRLIAQSTFDTVEARYKKAKAAVDAQEAAVKASRAALEEAEVNYDYANIRAPFDGVVLTKNADVGDIVTPLAATAEAKAAVVSIADMDSLQVEVDVSESNIAQVKAGQPCEVQLDALPDIRFRGRVHRIVPTADRTKASVMVKVAFVDEDSRILPEMSAKVAFLERDVTPEDQTPVTVIPAAAVVGRSGDHAVFVIRGQRAVEAPVRLGRRMGDMVQLLDGPPIGDKVVLAPVERIKDGVRVKVPLS